MDAAQANAVFKEQTASEDRRKREFQDQLADRRQVMIIADEPAQSRPRVATGYLPRLATGASRGDGDDARSELRTGMSRAEDWRAATAPSQRSASRGSQTGGLRSIGPTGASRATFKSGKSSAISLHERQLDNSRQEVVMLRTALSDFKACKAARQCASPGRAVHSHVINMGCGPTMKTSQQGALELPVSMAVNPKWSTNLKRMNDKIGERLNWERKITASVTGSCDPERVHMPKQTFPTNPPTPIVSRDTSRKTSY